MQPKIRYSTGALTLALALCPAGAQAQQWNLAVVRAELAHQWGYTGKGVLVAVIDSGIDAGHRAFRGRLDGRSRGFATSNPNMLVDSDGHGTHVAGIIGAARGVGPMYGIAYDANILALRSMDDNEEQNTPPALQYAAQLGVKVLNGSYGPSAIPARDIPAPLPNNPNNTVPNPAYVQLPHQLIGFDPIKRENAELDEVRGLEAAVAADVLMVFSAGNEYGDQPLASMNPSGNGLTPFIRPENHATGVYRFVDANRPDFDPNNPGTYGYVASNAPGLDAIDYSHLQGALITVVATDRANAIASYSNRCGVAWQWCMAAPGGDIDATGNVTPVDGILSSVPTNRYQPLVGTSMAAPLVAGAAAVMRGAFPYLTARQTIEIMLTTTDASGHLADRAIYGRGMLDLGRAIQGPREFGAEGFAQVFDVDTQGYDSTWSGDIVGSGGLIKRGAGNLTLSGVNTYQGNTVVAGGRLTAAGRTAASTFRVEPGATLGGVGSVGPIVMGGTLEAGQRVSLASGTIAEQWTGALQVVGDYTHLSSGTFVASLAPDGTSNRLDATGATHLQGGTLQVYGITASAVGQRYDLIRAAGGVTGDFAAKPNDYLFIDLKTRIEGPGNSRYTVSLERRDGGFATAARNDNQRAVAYALDRTTADTPIIDSLLMTREVGIARTALTQLAGDIHPSTLGALTQQSGLTRDAVVRRLRQAEQAVGASAGATRTPQTAAVWGQHIGDWGRMADNAGAASLHSSYQGMVFGADTAVGHATRLGLAAGLGQSTLDTGTGMARARIDSYTLAAFGNTAWDALRWRYGAAHSWHNIDSRRHVAIADAGRIETRYNARTAQAFAEVAYRQDWSKLSAEPFAALAYSTTRASDFTEPGLAGLRARQATLDTWFTTLGARLDTQWDLSRHGTLQLQAMVGWRHAMGGLTPSTTLQLAHSPAFSTSGVAPARNAAVFEAGVQWQPTVRANLALGYVGQLSPGAHNHGIQANAAWRF